MKQRLLYAMLGTMVLAACSDEVAVDKDLPSSPGVIVAAPPVPQPAGCSFKDAQTYAKNYFLVNTQRNAATSALSLAASLAVGTQGRTDALFTVLGLVADVAGNSGTSTDAGPASAGAGLISEVVDCGPLSVTDNRSFSTILASALTANEGEFAIRGTIAGDEAVIAESGEVAIAPNVGKPDWIDQVGRVAVFAGEATGIAFGGIGTNLVTPYRIGLIYEQSPPRATPPNFSDDDYFAVEFCGLTEPPGFEQQRVGRSRGQNNELNTVLQQSDIQNFCSDLVSAPSTAPSFFVRALDRVAGFFLPTPLQALLVAPPPWSGSTGGLESDFGVVQVGNVLVSVPEITNGVKNQPVNFTATAATQPPAPFTQIPLENVTFTVTVTGNQGDPVTLSPGNSLTTCSSATSCSAATDETGAANFSIIFDKAGGYTVQVTVEYDGFGDIVLFRTFNITGN